MASCTFFGIQGKSDAMNEQDFNFATEYEYQEELLPEESNRKQWALLLFETPVVVPLKSMVIGAKLDMDSHTTSCRIVFSGRLLRSMESDLSSLKVYRMKQKQGQIDRVVDEFTVIGKDLFKKETDFSLFIGLKVIRSSNSKAQSILLSHYLHFIHFWIWSLY